MCWRKNKWRIVPLRHHLKSGDTIEILTSKTQKPSKDWLNIVKSGRARAKIKQWLQKEDREKKKEEGTDIFEKACRVYGSSIKQIKKLATIKLLLKNLIWPTLVTF